MIRFISILAVLWLSVFQRAQADGRPIEISGSVTAALAVKPASEAFNEDTGIEFQFGPDITSSQAIAIIGEQIGDLGMTTRAITGADRAEFPGTRYQEYRLGVQALVFVVSKDVWNGGVKTISKAQFIRLYEREIKNWKELGGPDVPIQFYRPNAGKGVWEFLVTWAYGDVRRAPLGEKFDGVNDGVEARNSVEFNDGAMSVVPAVIVDNKTTFALSISDEKNTAPIEPTTENILNGKYPLARPISLIAGKRPTENVRRFLEYMTGEKGRDFTRKAGFVPDPKGAFEDEAKSRERLSN